MYVAVHPAPISVHYLLHVGYGVCPVGHGIGLAPA